MRSYLVKPWIAIGMGVLLGILGFAMTLTILLSLRPEAATDLEVTAIYTMIAAPTSTPLANVLQQSTPTPTENPELNASGIRVGGYVQVYGTGGEGLRLRAKPGTASSALFLAMEEEVFQVLDGPVPADGYVWWYLQAPYDKNRSGWAAASFLRVVALTPQP